MAARRGSAADLERHEEQSEEARESLRIAFEKRTDKLEKKVSSLDHCILDLAHEIKRMTDALGQQTEMIRTVYDATYTGEKAIIPRLAVLESRGRSMVPSSSAGKVWLKALGLVTACLAFSGTIIALYQVFAN